MYLLNSFIFPFASWCEQFRFGDERGSDLVCERLAGCGRATAVLSHECCSLAVCRRALRQGGQDPAPHTHMSVRNSHIWDCWAGTDAPARGVLRKRVCCKIIINNKNKSAGIGSKGRRTS